MTTVSGAAYSAATPDVAPWADVLLSLNSATGLVEWAPVVLFAGMLVWLAVAARPAEPETLNERSEREVEEARR